MHEIIIYQKNRNRVDFNLSDFIIKYTDKFFKFVLFLFIRCCGGKVYQTNRKIDKQDYLRIIAPYD